MSSKDMISAFWFLGSKIKIGRSPGLRPRRRRTPSCWDQGDLLPAEPRGLSKVEWNRTFSPNFFLNAKWAYYSTGFTLGARDGRANDQVYDRVDNEARGQRAQQRQPPSPDHPPARRQLLPRAAWAATTS